MIADVKQSLSLEALEHVLLFSLEVKSKCLIQACVMNAEQAFSGVWSFSHGTQLKFLLESICHIIKDNCQKEYIHILQYLEMVNCEFSHTSCEEEFIQFMLKLKQLFVLYNLLENRSVSNICFLMDDFFPRDNLLKGLQFSNTAVKKRFLSSIRREVLSFKRLVNRLLTDMEFRQDYFFEEYFEEFGEKFHSELLSCISVYLDKVGECLATDYKFASTLSKWRNSDVSQNPALLYFLKIVTDNTIELKEVEILSFLKWMFPAFDETLLTMSSTKILQVPEIFQDTEHIFLKMDESFCEKPWKYGTFDEFWQKMEQIDPVPLLSVVKMEPSDTLYSEEDMSSISSQNTQCLRVVLSDLSLENQASNVFNDKIATPENDVTSSTCGVDKENISVNRHKQERKISTFDTPQTRKLLHSGSQFFSGSKTLVRKDPPLHISGKILDSNTTVDFSDAESESDTAHVLNQSKGPLQWLNSSEMIGSTPRCSKKDANKSCRSLTFESGASDDFVSESDIEYINEDHVQPFVQMLDNSYVPDLSWYLEEQETKPCIVQLQRMSEKVAEDGTLYGCRMCIDDLKMIINEKQPCVYPNQNGDEQL